MHERPAGRTDLLVRYAGAADRLQAQVGRLPSEAWSFRPAEDAWTIREVVVHLADNEAVDFVRVRMAVAESGSRLQRYDEAAWARELDYANENVTDALLAFRVLRSRTHGLLIRLSDDAWTRVLLRPEGGQRTVEEKLRGDVDHDEAHLRQIGSIHTAWQAVPQQGGP